MPVVDITLEPNAGTSVETLYFGLISSRRTSLHQLQLSPDDYVPKQKRPRPTPRQLFM